MKSWKEHLIVELTRSDSFQKEKLNVIYDSLVPKKRLNLDSEMICFMYQLLSFSSTFFTRCRLYCYRFTLKEIWSSGSHPAKDVSSSDPSSQTTSWPDSLLSLATISQSRSSWRWHRRWKKFTVSTGFCTTWHLNHQGPRSGSRERSSYVAMYDLL